MRRLLGHAAPAAARTDRAGFARERDEAFEPTGIAPHPGEPPLQLAAAQEVAQLALDEAGQPGTVGGSSGLRQEAVEVRAHHLVQHRLRRRARRVALWQHGEVQRGACRADLVRPRGIEAAVTGCPCGM